MTIKEKINAFLQALYQYDAYTENGAVSNSTTGSVLVDYFAKAGTYRGRAQKDVSEDMARLWNDSPLYTLRILFYLRTVSRKSHGFHGEVTEQMQNGQGSRDEFRKGLAWLAKNQPQALYKNLWLVPLAGSWKDLWHDSMLGVLNFGEVVRLIKRGLDDPYHRALIAKYLPRIKSKSSRHLEIHNKRHAWTMRLCKELGWTGRDYRKFKSAPEHKAHIWQRHMSANEWELIDFKNVAGRALFGLTSKRGRDGKTTIERHDLEKRYMTWLDKQPTVKFTGFVYELFKEASSSATLTQKMTYNKQFDGLIEQAREDSVGLDENVWCALDTSGSMGARVLPNVSAYDICLSLGIYFSTLNTGVFQNHVIMFDSTSYAKKLKGSFCDKVEQLRRERTAWGSTNFQSVIDAIVAVRKARPNVPVSDFPTTLLVVSDMQFNPVGGNTESNYKAAMKKLAKVGLPKMKIIWWFVTGRGKDFPSEISDEGVTMIGGFDGSIVRLLLGAEPVIDKVTGKKRQMNAYENMVKALQQELLQEITI